MSAINDPATSWDNKYLDSERIWSGKVNQTLAETVSDLLPGTALDIGSGEGADVIWLAHKGWQAYGVDISGVAVERAKLEAQHQGLTEEQADFLVADMTTWRPNKTFDLVTSSFLHAQQGLDRETVLIAAKEYVSPGGHLLVIGHASFPPWAKSGNHGHKHQGHAEHKHVPTTAESEIQLLDLAAQDWVIKTMKTLSRTASGPNGETATLQDSVVLVQRKV